MPHALSSTRARCAALATGLALLSAIGCHDGSTAPQAPNTAPPLGPTMPSTNATPGDSPDNFFIALTVDPLYGSASVPAGTSLPAYPHPTVVRAVAAGMIAYSWNYAGLDTSGAYGPSGKAFMYWDDGVTHNNTVSFVYGGFVEPSVTTYATLSGTGTFVAQVTSFARSILGVATVEGYTPPGYTTPIWCGYPPLNPCRTYSGSATFTLTRLISDLSVTAESTTVSPGSTPYFDYRASPMTVEGQNIPFVVDSSSWVPDPDSLGGETAEQPVYAPGRGACQSQYNPACRRLIIGSGTFSLSAYVNGKRITKSVHVTTPSLVLTATPSAAYPGQSVSFTPSWSDGRAVSAVSSWSWHPNVSPGRTAACAASLTVCTTPVYENGTMTVSVTRNGVTRTARASVGVRDRFELHATPTLIATGAVVTFRPFLNGQPAPAMAWRWIPESTAAWDSVAGCPVGVTECHRATFASGLMWAYRSSQGAGDSASAAIAVSTDCPSALRRPASGRLSTRRASSPPRATISPSKPRAATAVVCGPGDGGTDSLPMVALHVVLESDGVNASPAAGDSNWPVGTVVPYSFLPKDGYEPPVAFVDDTLRASMGTITMSSEHTIRSATDSNFALRPGIAELRQRLRSIVNASDKPVAYAAYLRWSLDSAVAYYGSNAALNSAVGLAEYLEFDPVADASALGQLDDALANYGFEVRRAGAQHSIAILDPNGGSVMANRIPRRGAVRDVGAGADSGVAFIFVNGIRTLATGAFGTGVELQAIVNDTTRFPHAFATYYWNRNLRGILLGFADATLGCAGKAARDAGFRQRLTSLVRYGVCKGLSIVTIPILDDVGSAAVQFVNLQWGFATPQSADADRLAHMAADYHAHLWHTVMVTHSQGNMVFAQAAPIIPNYDGVPLQTNACTADLSLAAPITRNNFNIDQAHLRGMTIRRDILLVLGLPNDFDPVDTHYTSQATLDADTDIAAASSIMRPFLNVKWGVRVHDVNANYMEGVLQGTVAMFMQQLYDTCVNQ